MQEVERQGLSCRRRLFPLSGRLVSPFLAVVFIPLPYGHLLKSGCFCEIRAGTVALLTFAAGTFDSSRCARKVRRRKTDVPIVRMLQAGMSEVTEVIQGDFHKMPFADNSFDAIFSVEATCHASSVRSYPRSWRLCVCFPFRREACKIWQEMLEPAEGAQFCALNALVLASVLWGPMAVAHTSVHVDVISTSLMSPLSLSTIVSGRRLSGLTWHNGFESHCAFGRRSSSLRRYTAPNTDSVQPQPVNPSSAVSSCPRCTVKFSGCSSLGAASYPRNG